MVPKEGLGWEKRGKERGLVWEKGEKGRALVGKKGREKRSCWEMVEDSDLSVWEKRGFFGGK